MSAVTEKSFKLPSSEILPILKFCKTTAQRGQYIFKTPASSLILYLKDSGLSTVYSPQGKATANEIIRQLKARTSPPSVATQTDTVSKKTLSTQTFSLDIPPPPSNPPQSLVVSPLKHNWYHFVFLHSVILLLVTLLFLPNGTTSRGCTASCSL